MKRIMFTKMVQKCSLEEVAAHAKALGFSGVDLTCRAEGHVLPENVKTDLPRAVEFFRQKGLEVPMISTGITTGTEDYTEETFDTAGKCGVKYLKLGYWWCSGFGKTMERFEQAKQGLDRIEELAKKSNTCAIIHIHSDNAINAIPAFIQQLLAGRDGKHIGAYIDPGHMAVEGGGEGWMIGMDILAPYLKMVAVKNFAWFSRDAGNYTEWKAKVAPLKDGTAPWPKVFEILKKIGYDGYLSIHSEYLDQHSWKVLNQEECLEQTRIDLKYLDEIS